MTSETSHCLCNIRVDVTDSGKERTESSATPVPVDRGINKYTYNGKELQPQTGLLDYGARQYDAAVGRWFGVDALAMLDFRNSPYIYCSDNPINRIDLFGLTDINNDGIDDGISLPEVVVKEKRTKLDPLFGRIFVNYSNNYEHYGQASPYKEHFQAGGRDAALMIGAPLAAIAGVEMFKYEGIGNRRISRHSCT